MAHAIAQQIASVAPEGMVGDLFAGTGVVAQAIGRTRPVTAVDEANYSQVLTRALLVGKEADFLKTSRPEFWSAVDEVRSEIGSAISPLIELERSALSKARQGSIDLISQIIEVGSIERMNQGDRAASGDLKNALVKSSMRLKGLKLGSGALTATRYFGGSYFSYSQAADMDAIFAATANLPPRAALAARAVLLSVASTIVNTVGKQFAQPIKLQKADGTVPSILLERTLADRASDVPSVFLDWARRWSVAAIGSSRHKAVRSDVVQFLKKDVSCVAYYADPPYTIDHYSRFYHVLETLMLRDDPTLDAVTRRGEKQIMRGIYRTGRYQSPFCIPSQAGTAFTDLFKGTSVRGVPLLLSYSPFDASKGARSRLLTMEELIVLAKNYYSKVHVLELMPHAHRKLNRDEVNLEVRKDAERLIICEQR